MGLRTYYWNSRKTDYFRYVKRKYFNPEMMSFRYGNSGDIFNADLIKHLYETDPLNANEGGNRLLLVGSILSVIQKGDIICGIGWKGNDLSNKQEILSSAIVYGVRGPLTRSIFEKYDTNLSNLKFEYDPGLLIKEVYNIDASKSKEKNVIFIPHYRDLLVYKNYPNGIKVVNIDNKPETIAQEIMNAKVVYASSLHGIIFSHALNKPCVFVQPQSEEPIFKYRDYFLSIGMDMPKPIKSIYELNFVTDQQTILKRAVTQDDFHFPSKKELKLAGIV